MTDAPMASRLPLYHNAIDWDGFWRDYPVPDVFAETVFKWPMERIRELQERRFREMLAVGWGNGFYAERWRRAGLEPGDIGGLDDIGKLPTFNSDDIKDSQQAAPPYGAITGIDRRLDGARQPLKLQTSGGTTGKARPTLYGVAEWEMNGLQIARSLYLQGARPGEAIQIPATCSLANLAWAFYKGAHDYLGLMPLTTGSGVVTPTAKQIELLFDYDVDILVSFPEYLTQMATTAREADIDLRDAGLKFITSYLGPDTEDLLRQELEELFGCPVYDNYGTHEISHASFEGPDKDGMYAMEDCLYLEILDVETNLPVGPGETGNLVVTSLFRRIPPLIRFNLRDLARFTHVDRQSALGSWFRRMDKFLGRSDDMVKIRGVNVYPMACLNAVKSDPRTTGEWFVLAERSRQDGVIRDELRIKVEVAAGAGALDGLREILEQRLRADLGLRVGVELVDQGALDDLANIGREGKARRLLDRRFEGGQ
ncbi:MAG: AMP-binding protein [Alphaproteobacteria bacterium]|jgi:phenylacetate-CoA ligase|nr:AMP-binding protein [Alphaproteobacteria bacterium]MDP6563580.1 AMP-binding protein [Alphaproteobacteria bacterium]MDP6814271.1 AMP-binding protein [Alphaproteobacteria bacterium]